MRNASRPASVNIHRKSGGKRFWPHRLPQTALEHPETVEIRAPKSKWNKLKSAENRYKRAEKVFPISLGAGGPGFESPHSDHLSQKNRLFRRFFCIFSLIFAILVIAVLRRFLGQKSGGHMIEDCSWRRQIPNLSLTGVTAFSSLRIRQILEFSRLILYNNSTVSLCATRAAVWVYSHAAFL